MKTLVILFADHESLHVEDEIFGGKTALNMSFSWFDAVHEIGLNGAKDIEDCECETYKSENVYKFETVNAVFCSNENEVAVRKNAEKYNAIVVSKDKWNIHSIFEEFARLGEETSASHIIFSFADFPFLRKDLTEEIVFTHLEYRAEYTYSDGYPFGLCPEMISKDASAILEKLSADKFSEQGKNPVSVNAIFDFLKLDINSFDVETVISPEDFRLSRLYLDVRTKAGSIACKKVFESGAWKENAVEMCRKITSDIDVIKTVPSFYDISITNGCNVKSIYVPEGMETKENPSFMDRKKFDSLIKKISLFSEKAVVSLSAFGECFLHPDFLDFASSVLSTDGFSLMLETDGCGVTEELCGKLEKILSENRKALPYPFTQKIIFIVRIDGVSENTYKAIHEDGSAFSKAVSAVEILSRHFAGMVYPQMVRMDVNESELESFYRFWNEKTNPSGGNLIIQKYNYFTGLLPQRKPADLSPLERNPCWHLRRDMTILWDGSVPLCHTQVDSKIGNVFEDEIETVWKKMNDELSCHMCNKFNGKCGNCDEYYTFNF